MKRTILSVLLLAAAAWPALGFIEEPPSGAKPVPERNQEQLAKERSQHQGLVPEVGTVEEDTEPAPADESGLFNADNGSMATAENRKAAESLATAKKVQERAKSPNSTAVWGLVCLLAGFTVILAAKQVANRVVPPAKPPTKINW